MSEAIRCKDGLDIGAGLWTFTGMALGGLTAGVGLCSGITGIDFKTTFGFTGDGTTSRAGALVTIGLGGILWVTGGGAMGLGRGLGRGATGFGSVTICTAIALGRTVRATL
ncbi:hypothetical protein [Acidiferrobacter sp.]|jgi:hypothetical protein|uniref:hypothetical protein n=1 Tax=Acidiferrobacter sp. TaxID=1872107 RepID=UPI00262C6A53|nr:hypothetical protein [Acidiferrobacter sp.]